MSDLDDLRAVVWWMATYTPTDSTDRWVQPCEMLIAGTSRVTGE